VPEDELAQRVMDIATMIADNAPLTVAAMKYNALQAVKPNADRIDLTRCDEMVAACFASDDYKEGRRAFMEKRKPNFAGK